MKGIFQRCPVRELPDGTICMVFPFHISLEGLEERILCRDDEDCDAFVKVICVSCRRKNVILVIYSVVSNHVHAVVLAASQTDADTCADEIKRMLAMYHRGKYNEQSVMKGVDAKAILIDSDWYLRNALAYDVRNAYDNCADSIQSYKWTGYRGMFCNGESQGVRSVSGLSKRERRAIMGTDDDLSRVKWKLNENNELEPATICDWRYLEGAFQGDQMSFMRSIGSVNEEEMKEKLVISPRVRRSDQDFLRSVNEISDRWFKTSVDKLSKERKARLIHYVRHLMKTDPNQIARAFQISREEVKMMIGTKKIVK